MRNIFLLESVIAVCFLEHSQFFEDKQIKTNKIKHCP